MFLHFPFLFFFLKREIEKALKKLRRCCFNEYILSQVANHIILTIRESFLGSSVSVI